MTNWPLSLTMGDVASYVKSAQERVVLACPGIHKEVIASLTEASSRLGRRVLVVIDTNEEVFRLGFGSVDVFKDLQTAKVPLLRREGVRLGILLVDDEAWCFAPTALLVEVDSPDKAPRLNACSLPESSALQHLRALAGSPELELALKGPLASEPEKTVAIPVSPSEAESTCKQLEIAPPVNFDLHRQVLVYQSYIQYAELQFKGAKPESKKAQIPNHLLPLGADPEIEHYLQTTVDLFQQGVSETIDALNQKVEALRKEYLRSLGPLFGTVVLQRRANELEEKVAGIVLEIENKQLSLAVTMESERKITIDKITSLCTKNLLRSPNSWLRSRVQVPGDNIDRVRFLVVSELQRCLPTGFTVAGKMSLTCVFKDFTFRSLNDKTIFEKLRKAFPDEDWEKPFAMAKAALQKP